MKNICLYLLIIFFPGLLFSQLKINEKGYFHSQGLDVIVFSDFYPEGHQGGLTIIQHGIRTAANGDLRLEPTPGQWSPIPTMLNQNVDSKKNVISATLKYPDDKKNGKGFNPIFYPDLEFQYTVRVEVENDEIHLFVDLEKELPREWNEKVGFNFELFPGEYFGSSYRMDNTIGRFERQADGLVSQNHEVLPIASGKNFVAAPDKINRIEIESLGEKLELYDGRALHNNGWFIVRSLISPNKTKSAVEWIIKPFVDHNWKYEPVIQVSQVGYHPEQEKIAIIETDLTNKKTEEIKLFEIENNGKENVVLTKKAKEWGEFLRYNYLTFDFSKIKKAGIYKIVYKDKASNVFHISNDIYKNNIWQPTIDYFLPVQMCHMRVNDRYRVWHDLCHLDDALMAPVNHNHFDGYFQGKKTLSNFASYEHVPNMNSGGWHDAGDYDLRIESQAGTVLRLSWLHNVFNISHDKTTIDQNNKVCEINIPDGKDDILQQIEHGVLNFVNAYHQLGRLYRGVICPSVHQYVLLGDASSMTDNIPNSGKIIKDDIIKNTQLKFDDRLVFTEENPSHEFQAVAALASASVALKDYNPSLAKDCLGIAKEVWSKNIETKSKVKINAAVELYYATGANEYLSFINSQEINNKNLWIFGRLLKKFGASKQETINRFAKESAQRLNTAMQSTPYKVDYSPAIWGAGWSIQSYGVEQVFLHRAFPNQFKLENAAAALNFVLGVHPGINNSSFISGIGAKSLTVAYGINRADWSYIPGGSASGTSLIRPDLPELKKWPFFWQQGEYMISHAALDFVILSAVLDKDLNSLKKRLN